MPQLSDRMLPQRATVWRIGRTPNGRGGYAEVLESVATKVPCRLAGASLSRMIEVDGQMVAEPTRACYFRLGTDVRAQDVLTIVGIAGRLIVQAADPQADGVYLKCLVTEEQPDPLATAA